MTRMRQTGLCLDVLERLEKRYGRWIILHEPEMLTVGKGSAAWKKQEKKRG